MDTQSYARAVRLRSDAAVSERRKRAADARARLPEVVRILAGELGVVRVVLFGSLRRGELYTDSDVDLAVLGLEPADYWRAADRAAAIVGRPVDLVRLEEAGASLVARVEADGEVLHG